MFRILIEIGCAKEICSTDQHFIRKMNNFSSSRNDKETGQLNTEDLLQIFHGSVDALFIHTPQGKILELNQRALHMFALSRNQALELDFGRDFFAARAPLKKLPSLWSGLSQDRTFLFSVSARRPLDGRVFPVEVYMKKVSWSGREAVLTSVRDITRHKESQTSLRIKRKLLAAILDAVPIATFVIDNNHNVILWNKACENLTGVPREETLGSRVDSRIFYPGPPRPVLADLVLENNIQEICRLYGEKNLASCLFIPEALEARDTLTIRGIKKNIYFLAAPYRDMQSKVIGAIETIQDITDRTRVEEALKASESRLREVTANIPGAVYQYQVSWQEESGFNFVSDGVRWLLGLEPFKVLEDQQLFFLCMEEETRRRFQEALRACCRSDCLEEFEFQVHDEATGKMSWIKNKALSRLREDGVTIWNGVLTDITKEKTLEKMRSDVERIVRHDMKSPLIGISGLARLLLREDLSEKQRGFAVTIYQSGLKLLRMINNTMSLLQIEQGTYMLNPEEVNLVDIFYSLHEEFLPSAENKSVEFLFRLEDKPMTGEDKAVIPGERILLESLFANLLQNALDASPEGETITVSVSMEKKFCVVDIHNKGTIPESIRDKFFERYVTYGKHYGTGLGTYSAMLVARVHGGEISFTTSREEGTHLIVKLTRAEDRG